MNSSPCFPYISFGPLATRTCARERGRECERERGRGRPATPACVPVCVVVTTHVFFLYVYFFSPDPRGSKAKRRSGVSALCVSKKCCLCRRQRRRRPHSLSGRTERPSTLERPRKPTSCQSTWSLRGVNNTLHTTSSNSDSDPSAKHVDLSTALPTITSHSPQSLETV